MCRHFYTVRIFFFADKKHVRFVFLGNRSKKILRKFQISTRNGQFGLFGFLYSTRTFVSICWSLLGGGEGGEIIFMLFISGGGIDSIISFYCFLAKHQQPFFFLFYPCTSIISIFVAKGEKENKLSTVVEGDAKTAITAATI